MTEHGRLFVFAAIIIALAVPAWLLWPEPTVQRPEAPARGASFRYAPLDVDPELAASARLFSADDAAGATQSDLPILSGIVVESGRPVSALLKTSAGEDIAVGPGTEVDGWQVLELARDSVLVGRGEVVQRIYYPYEQTRGGG